MNIKERKEMEQLTLGEKIKNLRKKRGMTQQELAQAIPISFSTFRRWEKNIHVPDIEDITRLSVILDVPVSYFIEDKKEEELHVSVGTQTMTFRDGDREFTVPFDRELSLQILKSMFTGENISIMNGNNNNNAGSIIANVNS